ncbi:MAG: hypothetical protein OEY14_14910, partial [Myxococcales bacterium]|nr:hypothetical protein [Myxococcales bacterium]
MRSTLLVAGGILCTLVGLTQTDWGRDRMRDLAVQAIGDELGLDATFGQVRIDLRAYPPGIILVASDISLDDPEHGTFAEAEELRIHPSLLSLIRGELDLEEIEIDEPAVHLIVRDGTVINLPQPRITPAGGPGELPLRRLLARRAQLTIDAQPFADLLLDRVDIELLVSGGTQITLMADGRSGRLNHTRGVETLQRYIIAGSIDPERGLELERLLLRTPHYRVEITSATVPLPFDGSYAGEIALKVELSRLEHLPMLALPPIRGLLEADVQVNGTPDGPTGQGDLRLTDARVDGYGLGQLVQLAVDFDPQEIRVPAGEFHLIRDGGVVRASGSIGLDPAEGLPLDFEVGIDHLQFAKLMEQLGVTPNAIVQWDVSGQTRLRGTLDPLDLSGPIGLRTRDFLVTTGPWHEQPAQRVMGVTRARLDGEAHIRPAGLSFEALVGETPGSRLRGDVLIGFDNQLRVNARLSPVALSDVSPLLEFPLAGVGSAEAQIRGTFSDPVVTGHLQIDGFE